MKPNSEKVFLLIMTCLLSAMVSGQSFRSAYYLEGATFRHKMNPAFMSERNYISIPGLGNISAGTQGNVGLTDFIYKYDDPTGEYDLTTFMSSTVEREAFLNKLHANNHVQLNLDLTLLACGFYKWGGFNTFELDWHTNVVTNMPYALFDFMKSGAQKASGTMYHISDLRVVSDSYAEIAFGHARQIDRKLAVGGKFKILLAGAYMDANIERMDVSMAQDKWEIIARGTLDAAVSEASFETKTEAKGERINDLDVDDPGINGWGVGADFGATYRLSRNLTLSGALLDLGFISWKTTLQGATLNDPYTFDGFEDIAVNSDNPNDPNDFDEQLDNLGDDLKGLAKFYDQGEKNGKKTMLATTLNLGAEYRMPFYRKLSAGFLWSTRYSPVYTWTEGRVSANMSPVRWFDFSVDLGVSTLATSLGCVMNFHPKGFNFFIGSDQMILKVNSQYIPLNNLSANICMGFNVTFGKDWVN